MRHERIITIIINRQSDYYGNYLRHHLPQMRWQIRAFGGSWDGLYVCGLRRRWGLVFAHFLPPLRPENRPLRPSIHLHRLGQLRVGIAYAFALWSATKISSYSCESRGVRRPSTEPSAPTTTPRIWTHNFGRRRPMRQPFWDAHLGGRRRRREETSGSR